MNQDLRALTVEDQMWWFHCVLPVVVHAADDRRALRRRLGEFAHLGAATPAELGCACGLSSRSVYRARKLWAEQGELGFYAPRQPSRHCPWAAACEPRLVGPACMSRPCGRTFWPVS